MAKKIEEIEGIGPAIGEKLRNLGLNNTDLFLQATCTSAGRRDLAAKTGLNESSILRWANLADLSRIKGVSGQYSELLEAAGVDTVKELANRNAQNLTMKMREVNQSRKLVRQMPGESSVIRWIDEAKKLPPMISH